MRAVIIGVCVSACGTVSDEATTTSGLVDPIRVTVYKYGGDPTGAPIVRPNTTVEFIAPDLTKQTVVTDENGVAEAVSPSGTQVIVYTKAEGPEPFVRAFAAVNPGDSIIVDRTPRQSFPGLGEITFVLPRRGHGDNYQLHASCAPYDGSWWPEPTRTLGFANCPFATHATVVGYALDSNGSLLTGASVMTNLDLTALVGTTVRMPAYQPKPSTITGELVGLPGTNARWGVGYLTDGDWAVLADAFMAPVLDGTNSLPIVAVGDHTSSVLQFEPTGFRDVRVEDFRAERATTVHVEAAELIRPVGIPSYDFQTETISWPSASYGIPARMVHATLSASNVFIGSRVHIDYWAPGDTSSVTLPPLPAELVPQPGDRVLLSVQMITFGNETYTESMELVATRWATGPQQWEPAFTGRVWRAGP